MKIILILLILFVFILFAPLNNIWWWIGYIFAIFLGFLVYCVALALQNSLPDWAQEKKHHDFWDGFDFEAYERSEEEMEESLESTTSKPLTKGEDSKRSQKVKSKRRKKVVETKPDKKEQRGTRNIRNL